MRLSVYPSIPFSNSFPFAGLVHARVAVSHAFHGQRHGGYASGGAYRFVSRYLVVFGFFSFISSCFLVQCGQPNWHLSFLARVNLSFRIVLYRIFIRGITISPRQCRSRIARERETERDKHVVFTPR